LNNPNNANQILFNLAKKNQELNEVIERYPFKLEKNEKLLSVLVQSVDQNIRLPIICKNTDSFSKLDNEIIKIYPKFSFANYYYLCNGTAIVNKSQTLEQNKIKNGDILILEQK